MEEEASTGYRWYCDKDINSITINPQEGIVGGKVMRKFDISCSKKDGYEFYNFKYKRSWNDSVVKIYLIGVLFEDYNIKDISSFSR